MPSVPFWSCSYEHAGRPIDPQACLLAIRWCPSGDAGMARSGNGGTIINVLAGSAKRPARAAASQPLCRAGAGMALTKVLPRGLPPTISSSTRSVRSIIDPPARTGVTKSGAPTNPFDIHSAKSGPKFHGRLVKLKSSGIWRVFVVSDAAVFT